MRKITQEAVDALINGHDYQGNNTEVKNQAMFLFEHRIAWYERGHLYIQAVFESFSRISNTTKERLNGIKGVNVYTHNKVSYLNGQPWDGRAIRVEEFK